jgi:hypothetical protein
VVATEAVAKSTKADARVGMFVRFMFIGDVWYLT